MTASEQNIETASAPTKRSFFKAARPNYKPWLLYIKDIPSFTPFRFFVIFSLVTIPLAIAFDSPLANPLQIAYTVSVTLFMLSYFENLLDQLRPVLTLSDTEFAEEKRDMRLFRRRDYYGISLLAPSLFFIVNGGHPTIRNFWATGEMPLGFIIAAVIAILSWMIVIQCVYLQISKLRVFSRLADKHTKINLLHPEGLTPFGSAAVRALLLSVGSYTVIPLTLFFNGSNLLIPGLISMAIGLPFTFLLFYLPVGKIRRRIKDVKAVELAKIKNALSGERAVLDELHLDMGQTTSNVDLLSYRSYVQGLSNWPLSRDGLSRLIIYILIPAASWTIMSVVNTAKISFIQKILTPILERIN